MSVNSWLAIAILVLTGGLALYLLASLVLDQVFGGSYQRGILGGWGAVAYFGGFAIAALAASWLRYECVVVPKKGADTPWAPVGGRWLFGTLLAAGIAAIIVILAAVAQCNDPVWSNAGSLNPGLDGCTPLVKGWYAVLTPWQAGVGATIAVLGVTWGAYFNRSDQSDENSRAGLRIELQPGPDAGPNTEIGKTIVELRSHIEAVRVEALTEAIAKELQGLKQELTETKGELSALRDQLPNKKDGEG
ncbi:MAG: hypothetical protein AAF667_11495 [Pseudomonadota bacterium]